MDCACGCDSDMYAVAIGKSVCAGCGAVWTAPDTLGHFMADRARKRQEEDRAAGLGPLASAIKRHGDEMIRVAYRRMER